MIDIFAPQVRSLSPLLLGLSFGLAGCAENESKPRDFETATTSVSALASSGVSGTLTFTQVDGGVSIAGTISGLPPNTAHGFHIHENGACGDSTGTDGTVTVGGAAGGHWNPAGHMHAGPGGESHLGDLGNITANASGDATVSITKAMMTIGDSSMTDVLGKSVIVHANPDDLTTQPTGNAGGRIGCGVVAKG